jgi:hypothetical protein
MHTIDVDDWEKFEHELNKARQSEISSGRNAEFLYRGLSDSSWQLTTTLERRGRERMPYSAYYYHISAVKPQVESFTGIKWSVRDFPKVDQALRENDGPSFSQFPEPEEYSYMVHLRHHGFPSPLLDWTRSEFIAAYFAFRPDATPAEGKVAIYLFSDQPEFHKSTHEGQPQIHRTGPYVTTHRRHFLQQSDYTMSVGFDSQWYFAKHEEVFARSDPHQNFLWKFTIPWTERLKVLKLLDTYNLNAFSLFDSEETLMETMALRELDFHPVGTRFARNWQR